MLSAQSTVQYRFDTTSTDISDILTTGTVTSDGAHWAILRSSTGPVLWKGDADGTPQWARSLSQDDEKYTLTPMPDNGCLLVVPLASELQNAEIFDDTVTIHLGVTRLQADGSIQWQRRLSTTVLYPGDWGDAYVGPIIGEAAGNGSCILANVSWGMFAPHQYTPCLFRLSDTGDLLWTRAYGKVEAPWIDQWGGISNMMIATDGTGYLFSAGNSSLPGPMILRFNSDGSIIWARNPSYENAPGWQLSNAALNSADEPIMAGRASGFNGLRIRLDADGDLLNGNVYIGTIGGYGITGMMNDTDQEVLVADGRQFIRVDQAGDVIDAISIADTSFQAHTCTFVATSESSMNGNVVAMGNMHIVDDVFGYEVHAPQVWSFPIPAPQACLLEQDQVDGYLVPDTLVLLTPDTAEVSMEIPGSSEATSFSYPLLPPMAIVPVCDQFSAVPSIRSSLELTIKSAYDAERASIMVMSSQDATLTLLAANGAVLLNGFHVHGGVNTPLPLNSLAPGLYALRARSPRSALEAARAMIIMP